MSFVAESYEAHLLGLDLDVDCPDCGYPIWVRGSEVFTGCTVLCPCCRQSIRLEDANGGLRNAARSFDRQVEQAMKGIFE
jgi:hypothetical protein